MQTHFVALKHGNAIQRRAYDSLLELRIFEVLSEYQATLVSTICLDIDTPNSDLDIICAVHNHARFIQTLEGNFSNQDEFSCREWKRASAKQTTTIVCRFNYQDFQVEIFGQPISIEKQSAYLHFKQAKRLIDLGGAKVKDAIRNLKLPGIKTEPAIASMLQLQGDPYQAVIALESLADEDLLRLLKINGLS